MVTTNFALSEFNPHNIDLTTTEFANFQLLAENMQAIRDVIGKPITITSGKRSLTKNNQLTGSSKTSQHLYGEACDFVVNSFDAGQLDDLFSQLVKGVIKLPHTCSQIIRESNGKGAEWVHIGLKTERWLEYNKRVIASDANAVVKAKATKRLTACEYLITRDAINFQLVAHRLYGDW